MSLASIGSFIIGASKSLSLGIFARLIIGLGCGPVYITITRYNANWFNLKWYGIMEGAFLAIGCIGAILAQSPLAAMCNGVGWRNSFYIIGGATLFFAILCAFFVRGSPTAYGYRHVNRQMEEVYNPPTFIQRLKQLWDNLIIVCTYPWYWIPCMHIILSVPPYYTTAGMWASSYMQHVYGFSKQTSGNMLTCITSGVLTSDLITPWISNLVKSRKWVCAVLSILAVFISIWGYYRNDIMSITELGILFFAYGYVTMPSFCVCSPLFREYYHPQVAATAIGLANALDCISSGLFQMFVSWVIETNGQLPDGRYTAKGYRNGIWLFTIVIDSVSFIFISFAKETPFFKQEAIHENIQYDDGEHDVKVTSDSGDSH
ncbi:major facilitator superfamily transporter [Tritrichomonas foetus]|uniref:Lysosomal dipeptide transporter MFSD1 n=1 Tax=Tritrichomonas foetus TaxID=1144522 RepID=A0A1J4L1A6_9EUKA|nr:major facilitator superfamily transporter [Tritrichomonas foetus]|eukprot:OHT17194.1 major facilitator superfamily transporter [Tritrichomonas foetus]